MEREKQQSSREKQIKELGKLLSFQTLMKIQIRIQDIRIYYGHFQKIKKFLPENEYDLVYRVYFITIATLYRSLFKGLDKKYKIDFEILNIFDNEIVRENHYSLVNIVDKDLAHLDKNSQSHKILDVQMLKNNQSTTLVRSFISENKLKKTIDFLNIILDPVVQEAIMLAKK